MPPENQAPAAPSRRQLMLATAGAVAAALFVLIIAVLPAEYGVDPLGTGAALGLVRAVDDPPAPPSADGRLIPSPMGPVSYYASPFATDRVQFTLGPYEYVEYKYRLEAGATVMFTWQASSVVLHELHADPDGGEDHTPVSFDKSERRQASGTHVAPFSGMHGWLWENPGSTTITVSLTSAGFYSSAMEYRSNGTRIGHTVGARGDDDGPKPVP